MYNVIFETAYVTKILFSGTMQECKHFIRANKHICGDDAFVQQVDECFALLK